MRCIKRASSLFSGELIEFLHAIRDSLRGKYGPVCASCSLISVAFLRRCTKPLLGEWAAEFVFISSWSNLPNSGGNIP